MTRIKVRPGDGRIVPMPDGRVLQGTATIEVPRDHYVERRLACGDLVLAGPVDAGVVDAGDLGEKE